MLNLDDLYPVSAVSLKLIDTAIALTGSSGEPLPAVNPGCVQRVRATRPNTYCAVSGVPRQPHRWQRELALQLVIDFSQAFPSVPAGPAPRPIRPRQARPATPFGCGGSPGRDRSGVVGDRFPAPDGQIGRMGRAACFCQTKLRRNILRRNVT